MSMRTGGSACTHAAAPDATKLHWAGCRGGAPVAGQVIRLVRPAEPDRLLDDLPAHPVLSSGRSAPWVVGDQSGSPVSTNAAQ